jgi:hypothetical protein
MKTLKCPDCKADITRYWINPIRKDQYVGRCSSCRKMVNLGSIEEGSAGAEGGKKTTAKKVSGKRKAAPASGAGGKRSAAAAGKRPVRAGADPEQKPAAAKPGAIRRALTDFFGL